MKRYFILFVLSFGMSAGVFSQNGSSCIIAEPFCTGVTYAFPMGTNTSAESGPNYGCLASQPNPYWYYMRILDSGNITIHLSSPTDNDIDFACWGPFNSPTGACTAGLSAGASTPTDCPANGNPAPAGSYPSGNMIDCSFDVYYVEDVHISNAVAGQYYMLLITNYSNSPGNIEFTQSNNTVGLPGVNYGTTDCAIITPCEILTLTATPGLCVPATNTYTITGTVTIDTPPATGSLVISDNAGGSQTFNAPFATSYNYTISNNTSDGLTHTITAQFSDDQFCMLTTTYTAPAPCSFCFANAGTDFTVCGLTTNLAAVPNATDLTQVWSCATPGVTINQTSVATTQVTVPTAGTYVFRWTITNSSSLSCYDEVSVTFNQIPTSTFTASSISCFGGTSTVAYTGNAPAGATYGWNFGGGTASPGTGQGSHAVTWATAGIQTVSLIVTNNGCTSTQTQVQVTNPPQLAVSVNTSDVTCASGTNGQANVSVTGGTGTPDYIWSNVTGPPFAAGNYTVTVTDDNNCTATSAFSIAQPNSINVIPSQTNVACFGASTGGASVSVTGGTPTYNYIWSNGGSSSSISNVLAGNYTVTIIDANICTTTSSFVLTQPTAFTASVATQNNPMCQGVCNGNASVSPTGGTPNYNYAWPGAASVTQAAVNLCSGTYVVTITDSQNCTATTTVTLSDPPGISVAITSFSNVSCFNGCNGTATALASGGAAGINSYIWSNGQNTATATNLCAGTYTVTASDVNGCSTTTTVDIAEPTQLTVAVGNQVGVLCYGDCNGVGSVNPAGGTPPYAYYWGVSAWTQQINSTLCAGSHFVTVTDANGCTANTMVVITGPSELTITNVTPTPLTCNGANDGQAVVTLQGGYAAYQYTLGTTTNGTGIFTGLAAGNYGITVSDANNCTRTGSVTITEPNPIVLGSTPNFTLCNGQTGFIQTSVTGGTPQYTYYWNGVQGNSILQVNPSGLTTYTVNVVDANGCSSNYSSTIVNVTPPVQLEILASPPAVCPGEPVMLNVNITEGAGEPYIVRYNGMIVVPPVTVYPNQTGQYILSVEDNCGSIDTDSILITVYPVPVVTFISDTVSGCQPLEVLFHQFSSVPGISYVWNFGDASYDEVSYDINPTHRFRSPGIFDVSLTVTSVNGCVSTTTINDMITVYPKPDSRFDADPQIVSIIKPQVQFNNLSTLANWYIWHFGDGDSSSIVHPMHLYPAIQSYTATLIAITNQGCKDTSSLVITVRDEFSFYAPSAFSPNNDAINDIFFVLGHGIDPTNFKLEMYDRWGMLQFETDKYDDFNPAHYGWNGTTLSGAMAPIGVYTWLCRFKDGMNILHEKVGTVTLIR
ncbi:MAG: hypothetical protein CVU05_05340 [Bacteroidetes bacterium HGW-Bacteroidetes-21]|nr:MAG: hypothetical protein CVU05_05340 [Bacteroidetes bacterium HGW-Bacteroidetes-21]